MEWASGIVSPYCLRVLLSRLGMLAVEVEEDVDFDVVVVMFHCGNLEVRDVALVVISGSLNTHLAQPYQNVVFRRACESGYLPT